MVDVTVGVPVTEPLQLGVLVGVDDPVRDPVGEQVSGRESDCVGEGERELPCDGVLELELVAEGVPAAVPLREPLTVGELLSVFEPVAVTVRVALGVCEAVREGVAVGERVPVCEEPGDAVPRLVPGLDGEVEKVGEVEGVREGETLEVCVPVLAPVLLDVGE